MQLYVYIIMIMLGSGYLWLYRRQMAGAIDRCTRNRRETKLLLIMAVITLWALLIFPEFDCQYPRSILLGMILMNILCYALYWLADRKQTSLVQRVLTVEIKENKEYIIGMVVTVIICTAYCILISFKTMPIAEGWYSAYARLINEGQLPYKDFELLFTPLYSYIIAFITRIFGYDIYVLRVVGVILFAILAVLFYMIYTKLFKSAYIGCISAVLSAFYMQSEMVQIFYDYIRFFDFCVLLTGVCLLKYLKGRFNKNRVWSTSLFIAGIMSGCGFLIRQNSGAIVIAYVIVFLAGMLIIYKQKKIQSMHLLFYAAGVVLPIGLCGLFMQQNGMLDIYLTSTTSSAIAAKGGMVAVLFAWIPRVLQYCVSASGMIGLLGAVILGNYVLLKKYGAEEKSKSYQRAGTIIFVISVFVGIFACYKIVRLSTAFSSLRDSSIPFVSFIIIVALFIYELIRVIWNRKHIVDGGQWNLMLMAIAGLAFAVNYGSGTSASLSEGQTALNVGLILGLILYLAQHKFGRPIQITAVLIAFSMIMTIVSYKYEHPYSWWGLNEGDLREATQELNVPNVSHIKVSEETKEAIEGIVRDIQDNSEEGDSIFVFPHAPVFYVMTDRWPETYSLVQWFDVAVDSSLEKDMETLEENMPKVIVHIEVPENAVKAHEESFRNGEKSGLHTMDIELKALEAGQYSLVNRYELQEYPVRVYVRND